MSESLDWIPELTAVKIQSLLLFQPKIAELYAVLTWGNRHWATEHKNAKGVKCCEETGKGSETAIPGWQERLSSGAEGETGVGRTLDDEIRLWSPPCPRFGIDPLALQGVHPACSNAFPSWGRELPRGIPRTFLTHLLESIWRTLSMLFKMPPLNVTHLIHFLMKTVKLKWP